jgi:hypothetical protein
MNWASFIQYFNLALGIALIVRLFSIRLQKAYGFFCGYLIADLAGSIAWILYRPFAVISNFTYWYIWLATRPVAWVFTLLTIYFLLEKTLVQLPGLLRLSKRILHGVFLLALLVGLLSAWYEYTGPGVRIFSEQFSSFQQGQFLIQCWMIELIFDRVIASAALLSLLGIMGFLFWFPITIPRNLAVFSVSFTVYFAAMTTFLLFRSLWPDSSLQRAIKATEIVSFLISGISGACYAFWIYYLSPEGEAVASQLAIQRKPHEQERLITQLELINKALIKTVHH